jgi:hypothetical protein
MSKTDSENPKDFQRFREVEWTYIHSTSLNRIYRHSPVNSEKEFNILLGISLSNTQRQLLLVSDESVLDQSQRGTDSGTLHIAHSILSVLKGE